MLSKSVLVSKSFLLLMVWSLSRSQISISVLFSLSSLHNSFPFPLLMKPFQNFKYKRKSFLKQPYPSLVQSSPLNSSPLIPPHFVPSLVILIWVYLVLFISLSLLIFVFSHLKAIYFYIVEISFVHLYTQSLEHPWIFCSANFSCSTWSYCFSSPCPSVLTAHLLSELIFLRLQLLFLFLIFPCKPFQKRVHGTPYPPMSFRKGHRVFSTLGLHFRARPIFLTSCDFAWIGIFPNTENTSGKLHWSRWWKIAFYFLLLLIC